EAALAGARALRYENLGTMEFLVAADGVFHFLEMNPRLQVEHTVTEAVTGVDLVAESLRAAAGEPLAIDEPAPAARGHAIECRIYAEESGRPSGGVVRRLHVPGGPGIRGDLGVGAWRSSSRPGWERPRTAGRASRSTSRCSTSAPSIGARASITPSGCRTGAAPRYASTT